MHKIKKGGVGGHKIRGGERKRDASFHSRSAPGLRFVTEVRGFLSLSSTLARRGIRQRKPI